MSSQNSVVDSGTTHSLVIVQQPRQSRACGFSDHVDRRPVDPPPILQLRLSKRDPNYLHNPFYFVFANIIPDDEDNSRNISVKDTRKLTIGNLSSSPFRLKDLSNEEGVFFVFNDINIRMEGSYRFRFSLYERKGSSFIHHCHIMSEVFKVYSAKNFPGVQESTAICRFFGTQGLKIRARKEVKPGPKRRRPSTEDEQKPKLPSLSQLDSEMSHKNSKRHYVYHGESHHETAPRMQSAAMSHPRYDSRRDEMVRGREYHTSYQIDQARPLNVGKNRHEIIYSSVPNSSSFNPTAASSQNYMTSQRVENRREVTRHHPHHPHPSSVSMPDAHYAQRPIRHYDSVPQTRPAMASVRYHPHSRTVPISVAEFRRVETTAAHHPSHQMRRHPPPPQIVTYSTDDSRQNLPQRYAVTSRPSPTSNQFPNHRASARSSSLPPAQPHHDSLSVPYTHHRQPSPSFGASKPVPNEEHPPIQFSTRVTNYPDSLGPPPNFSAISALRSRSSEPVPPAHSHATVRNVDNVNGSEPMYPPHSENKPNDRWNEREREPEREQNPITTRYYTTISSGRDTNRETEQHRTPFTPYTRASEPRPFEHEKNYAYDMKHIPVPVTKDIIVQTALIPPNPLDHKLRPPLREDHPKHTNTSVQPISPAPTDYSIPTPATTTDTSSTESTKNGICWMLN
ncbi:velvet factor-domain-containing protein [Paraphysoderma sedebokerense]|nr:velvet factor-domain-containing protein [Paraphysoderma sedebokerense]